jgi:hypothetical protein
MTAPTEQHSATLSADFRTLLDEERDQVSGGMKWTRVKNPDVIDARGGSRTILGFIVTFDINGDPSSVRPK